MYHQNVTYNLSKTPLENLIELCNANLKAGIPPLKLSDMEIKEVEHIDGSAISRIQLAEVIKGVELDTVDLFVAIPEMQVLINELRSSMELDVVLWDVNSAELFKDSLHDAATFQGWDLKKQINITDVTIGSDSLGNASAIIIQDNPFYKKQLTFSLPISGSVGIAVNVEASELNVSENF